MKTVIVLVVVLMSGHSEQVEIFNGQRTVEHQKYTAMVDACLKMAQQAYKQHEVKSAFCLYSEADMLEDKK